MRDKRVLVVLVYFALFVLILALLGVIFDKKITGYQILGGNEETIPNTMTLRNDDVTTMTNYPVQFGRAFVQGEIPPGFFPQVSIDGVPVQTQVDVKNRHVDGSLRFAVISLIVPSLNVGQTKTLTFQSIFENQYSASVGNFPLSTAEMLATNYNFDAVMELVNPAGTHTLSARTMLQDNNIHKYWISGPIVTTVVLADHSNTRQYDVGWEQQNTKLTKCVAISSTSCSASTILEVADASWVTVGQVLNLQEELVFVQAVNTVGQNTITVQRNYGGLLGNPDQINANNYVTATTWQPTFQANHKSFRPIYVADFWPAPVNKVRVRFIGENSNTEAMQDLSYDLNLKTGFSNPVNVFSDLEVTHHIGARWTKQFWLTPVSEKLSVDHNKNYLAQTGFADYYDPAVQPSSNVVSNWYDCYTSGNPISCGPLSLNNGGNGIFQRSINVYTAMGPGGGRWELGPIPQTNALWLNNPDWRMQHVAIAMGDLAGSWPVHFREGDSNKVYNRDPNTGAVPAIENANAVLAIGKPVSVNARPTLSFFSPFWTSTSPSDKIDIVSRFTLGEKNNPLIVGTTRQQWSTEWGHYYNFEPILYLLTGDYFRFEQLDFWASYSTLSNGYARGPGSQGGGQGGGLTDLSGPRYQCRPNYVRSFAAAFAVDGTPEKEHYKNMVYDAIITWMGFQNIPLSEESTISPTAWNMGMWNFGRNKVTNPGNLVDPSSGFQAPDLPAPLKFWIIGSSAHNLFNSEIPPGVARFSEAPWMTATCVESLSFAKSLGYPAGSLLQFLSDYYAWHFTGFDYRLIGAAREATTDFTGTPYAAGVTLVPPNHLITPAQVALAYTQAYLDNPCVQEGLPNFCSASNGETYLTIHTAAAARLYSYGQSAYDTLRNSPGVLETYSLGIYNKDPRYALAPLSNSICTPNAMSSCSTGLPGVCSAGQRACNSAGNGYSSCVANILPGTQTEICGDGLDNDCDGSTDECPPNAPNNLTANAV